MNRALTESLALSEPQTNESPQASYFSLLHHFFFHLFLLRLGQANDGLFDHLI